MTRATLNPTLVIAFLLVAASAYALGRQSIATPRSDSLISSPTCQQPTLSTAVYNDLKGGFSFTVPVGFKVAVDPEGDLAITAGPSETCGSHQTIRFTTHSYPPNFGFVNSEARSLEDYESDYRLNSVVVSITSTERLRVSNVQVLKQSIKAGVPVRCIAETPDKPLMETYLDPYLESGVTGMTRYVFWDGHSRFVILYGPNEVGDLLDVVAGSFIFLNAN